MKAIFLGLGFLALSGGLAACSSAPSKVNDRERSALEGRSLLLHQEPSVGFSMNASSAVLGLALGGPFFAGANAHNAADTSRRLQEMDHLVDPATVISAVLLTDLASTYHMQVVDPASASDSAADFVLTVKLKSWMAIYLLTNPNRYGGLIQAQASLVQVSSRKTLREAQCVIRPYGHPDAPTLVELLQSQGERLRAELDYSTDECIKVLKGSLLGE